MSSKWPVGVFTSIDAGLGVRLEVAQELGVTSIHLHTPHAASRTPQRAAEFNKRLDELGIKISVVFAGFEGESYADIPTVVKTVGLTPKDLRAERTAELKAIGDFARTLGDLPAGAKLQSGLVGKAPLDVIIVFVDRRAELAAQLAKVRRRMAPAAGFWVAWPKKASKIATDMTEDVVREIALPTGLVDNKVCAIDDIWSGLRLVIRLEQRKTP